MPSASAPFRAKAPFHSRKIGLDYRAFPLDFINPPFAHRFGCLSLHPSDPLEITGHEGGPFSPGTTVYTLTNTGGATMTWTLTLSETWLTADILTGTIIPGDTEDVTVTVDADGLPSDADPYTAFLTFTNTSNDCGNIIIPATLTVSPVLGMVVESRVKSGTAALCGYAEYWNLNPPYDAISAVPFPSHPPKKYRTQTLGGSPYLKCQHRGDGTCTFPGGDVDWREISGTNKYSVSTCGQTNTQIMVRGHHEDDGSDITCVKQGPTTSTEVLNPGAIGRPTDYIPFLYGWGFIEMDIPGSAQTSTPTTINWIGKGCDYVNYGRRESGTMTFTLSDEDLEIDAINRMVASLSWSSWSTAATKGAAYSAYELRDPDVWPSDFDFAMRWAEYRLTRAGLLASTLYSGNAKTYRRPHGTADPWVFVANISLSGFTDGSGNFSTTAVMPVSAGYDYTIWDAVIYG